MTLIICRRIAQDPSATGREALKDAYRSMTGSSYEGDILSGRPDIGGYYGSITHSGHVAIAAVSQQRIGVDVERIRPVQDDLSAWIGSAQEFALIDEHATFVLWCAKEAVLKAIGVGLDEPMRSLRVYAYKPGLLSLTDGRGVDWRIAIAITDGYVFACAAEDRNLFGIDRAR